MYSQLSVQLQSKVKPFNMDGREFWRHVRTMQRSGEVGPVHHVLMNLPAIALEFLGTVFSLTIR
jgi:tRNA G37 N-methylase Trm5